MGDLLAQTVPLSLAAAISPLVLMGALALLGREHGTARAAAYTAGFVAMATLMIVVGYLLMEARQHRSDSSPFNSPAADAIMGIALIAFGVLMVRPKRKADDARANEQHRRRIKPDSSLFAFALFGVVMMCINVSSIVLLLAVLKEVAHAHAGTGPNVVALAIADLCTALPAAVPLAAAAFGGAAVAAKVTKLGAWTNRNGKYILLVIFVLFGVQDVLKAFGH